MSDWQVADTDVPDNSSPNNDAEADMIPMSMDNMKIMPHPEVTIVDIEHTVM
jgi:hypothetical protein